MSKRIRKEEPELTPTNYSCFVCHAIANTCDANTVHLPCCKQFVHRRCQKQWETTRNTCGLCRTLLPGLDGVPPNQRAPDAGVDFPMEDELPPPAIDTDRIANEVLNLTREEVLERLRGLLNAPELEEQLQRVSSESCLLKIMKECYTWMMLLKAFHRLN